MLIDRAGLPFIGGALLLALIVGLWLGRAWAVPFLILAAFFLFFFRDPDRTTPPGDTLVVSPADARIMAVGEFPGKNAPPGKWQWISMFLSPMNVHVNRTSVTGVVTRVEYHPGKFLAAYKPDAGDLNEWTEVWFDTPYGPVVQRQIVGILARRIVNRLKVGDRVEAGQRYGVMKFGSRIDMFLPLKATIYIKVGEKVVSGETKIATLEP